MMVRTRLERGGATFGRPAPGSRRRAREDWIASLDRITALQPRIVVSGHKRVGAADDPKTISESQQYLRDFSRVVASEQTVEGIVSAMLELHPDRDNPRVVWHSAREAVKKRQQA